MGGMTGRIWVMMVFAMTCAELAAQDAQKRPDELATELMADIALLRRVNSLDLSTQQWDTLSGLLPGLAAKRQAVREARSAADYIASLREQVQSEIEGRDASPEALRAAAQSGHDIGRTYADLAAATDQAAGVFLQMLTPDQRALLEVDPTAISAARRFVRLVREASPDRRRNLAVSWARNVPVPPGRTRPDLEAEITRFAVEIASSAPGEQARDEAASALRCCEIVGWRAAEEGQRAERQMQAAKSLFLNDHCEALLLQRAEHLQRG